MTDPLAGDASDRVAPWRGGQMWAAALAAALVLTAVLRLWGIGWGAPYLYHPDEHLVLQPALNIVRTGDPNPHWFQYPSLLIYTEAALVAVLRPFVGAPLTTDPAINRIGPWDALPSQWPYALAGRVMVALAAIAGACLVGLCGWRYAGGAPAGVAAVLFLAAAPLHNESSHYLTTDVPAATLLSAALLAAIAASATGKTRWFGWAGLFAGLAAATKYTAGVVVLVPLAAALSDSPRVTVRRWALILAAALGGFILACPFALLDFHAVWSGIAQQRQNYLGGYTPGGSNWRWYAEYLYALGLGRPLAILALAGMVKQLLPGSTHRWPMRLAMLVVPLAYYAVIASYPARAERNLILVLPFLCLLAADAWAAVTRWLGRGWAGAAIGLAGAVLIAAPGIGACIAHDRQLMLPDTRTIAVAWFEQHVPAGARVAREEYTPQLAAARYDVIYQWSLGLRDYGWYLGQRVDYLVASAAVWDRALSPPYVIGQQGAAFYRWMFDKLPLETEITPNASRTGPTIRVYRVPHG